MLLFEFKLEHHLSSISIEFTTHPNPSFHLSVVFSFRFLPTSILGDLDSIHPSIESYYSSKGVAIKRLESQYSTDLQKCLTEVEEGDEQGKDEVSTTPEIRFSLIRLSGGRKGVKRIDQGAAKFLM